MTSTLLPEPAGRGTAYDALVRALAGARSFVRAVLLGALGTARQVRLTLARVVAWFAADLRRLRTAVAGLLLCTATGALLGLGVGLAAEQAVTVLLGLVHGP